MGVFWTLKMVGSLHRKALIHLRTCKILCITFGIGCLWIPEKELVL